MQIRVVLLTAVFAVALERTVEGLGLNIPGLLDINLDLFGSKTTTAPTTTMGWQPYTTTPTTTQSTTTMAPPTTTTGWTPYPTTPKMTPYTTTMAPVTTTMAPVTTTMAPVTTTMAPYTTTMAPVTTTMAPVTTTMAPLTTAMAPPTNPPNPSCNLTSNYDCDELYPDPSNCQNYIICNPEGQPDVFSCPEGRRYCEQFCGCEEPDACPCFN